MQGDIIFENPLCRKNAPWQKLLLPFPVDENLLPNSLKNRTKTREKKWVGIVVTETDKASSKVAEFN